MRNLVVLVDPDGSETIESVAKADSSRFNPLRDHELSAGYTRNVHWLRFTVDAPPGEWWLDVEEPFLDDIRLFESNATQPGAFRERRAGDFLPFSVREVAYRNFVFKLVKTEPTPTTYHLRVQTHGATLVALQVRSPPKFFADSQVEYALLFGNLGILMTVLFLSILSGWWSHEPLSRWFSAFLLFHIFTFLGNSGLIGQYVLPNWPAGVNTWLGVSALLMHSCAYGFYGRLFEVGPERRLLYTVFRIAFWLPLACIVSVFSGHYTEVIPRMLLVVAIMAPLNLYLAFRMWRRHAAAGSHVFVSNLISMTGYAAFGMSTVGLISSHDIFNWGLQISALCSSLTMHLALRQRSQAFREAHERTSEAIRVAERDRVWEREMRLQQSKFLAMISHEVRNALAVLRMAVGVQPMGHKAVASAERAITGMSEVIERSLLSEKFDDGAKLLKIAPCSVREHLHSVVANCRSPERVVLHLNANPRLLTDPNLLAMVLSNLMDNALKYSPSNTNVDLHLKEQGSPISGVIVTVTNAVGVAGAPSQHRVFEKYYRASGAHGHTGSGLGLHLSQQMVLAMGGQLRYVPQPERVVFELVLPLQP